MAEMNMFQAEEAVRTIPGARRSVTTVVSRTVSVGGQKRTISTEEIFWLALKRMASRRGMCVSALIAHIDERRAPDSTISSSIRVYVLMHICERLAGTLDCKVEEVIADLLGDKTDEGDGPAHSIKRHIKHYRELLKVVKSEAKREHIRNLIALEEVKLRNLNASKKDRRLLHVSTCPPT